MKNVALIGLLCALLGVALALQWPEIQRYLKIKSM
jgi:hypothetical protein